MGIPPFRFDEMGEAVMGKLIGIPFWAGVVVGVLATLLVTAVT